VLQGCSLTDGWHTLRTLRLETWNADSIVYCDWRRTQSPQFLPGLKWSVDTEIQWPAKSDLAMASCIWKTTVEALQHLSGEPLLMAKFDHIILANIDFTGLNSHVLPFSAFYLFSYFQCM